MINYEEWAANLLEEIYYAPQDQRISLIKEHLERAHRRGQTENEWWEEQDQDIEWVKDQYKKKRWL